MEANFNRELFTRHGFHTNNWGKEMIAVPVYWEENHDHTDSNGTNSNTESNKKQNVILDQRYETIWMSKRHRKLPITKRRWFFLW